MHEETFDTLTGLLNGRGFVLSGAARPGSASNVSAVVGLVAINNLDHVRQY